jgi:hypothetical protein
MYADPDDPEGWHTCHFCGQDVNKDGYEPQGNRHFLSDCRSDLVEHEIGSTCTWDIYRKSNKIIEEFWPEETCCYAYQDPDRQWTKEHKYFYTDGPM